MKNSDKKMNEEEENELKIWVFILLCSLVLIPIFFTINE